MKRKLIFLVTEDWYFHMHRLPQARAARDDGFEVCVATRIAKHGDRIEAKGFRLLPLKWRRGSLSPLLAVASILAIRTVYCRERPDIVHHVSLKSILLGTIAARMSGVPIIVNAFTGLGLLFLGNTPKIKLLRLAVFPVLRITLRSRHVHAIVENADHKQTLVAKRMLKPEQVTVIRGSGIDVDHFHAMSEASGPPVAACAARMLRSKGILVLTEAMRLLNGKSALKLLLAGMPDPESSDSLTKVEMDVIFALPNIEWLGHMENIRDLWARAHIGVLASITGEGLPVSLLEAASCGRPLVATDVAGCREVVRNGINGILVPANDARALADALEALAGDAELRLNYGAASRSLVANQLSAQEVGRRTVQLYLALLDHHGI